MTTYNPNPLKWDPDRVSLVNSLLDALHEHRKAPNP